MKTLPLRLWGRMALLSSLLLAGIAPRAHASEYFGQRGQFFLGGASSLNAMTWQHNRYKSSSSGDSDLEFGLAPQLGIFLSRNFYLGADIAFSALAPGKNPSNLRGLGQEILDSKVSRNQLTLGAGPRVGFNIDFGRGVSLMPNLGVAYHLQRVLGHSLHGITANVKVPFVFQIAQHGALLVGPEGSYSTNINKVDSALPATFRLGLTGGLLIWI